MAKAKKEEIVVDNSIDIVSEIEKTFGEGVALSGDVIKDSPPQIIPFSPSMDRLLGDGIPEGSWVSILGPEGCGKTVSALSFCAEAQKPENGSRPIFFFPVEGRLKHRDLNGIAGLDTSPSKFTVIKSTEEKLLSGVDILTIMGRIIETVKNAVIVVDSVSSLCSEKIITEGFQSQDRGGFYQVVSNFINLNAQIVPIKKTIVIGILHQIANTSGYGSPTAEKSANRWKYQADIRIACKKVEPWATGSTESGTPIGQKVTWELRKSALSTPPRMTALSFIRYGQGIDKVYELLNEAQAWNIIENKGAWNILHFLQTRPNLLKGTEFEGKDSVKIQGGENVYEQLMKNPKWIDAIKEELKEKML